MEPTNTTTLPKDFIFFDLETTGLDARHHEIIEIGAVRTAADLQTVRGTFEAKIQPEHLEKAMPEALAVNGYADDAWRKARKLRDVLEQFCTFGSGGVLAAYNITFDWEFLHAALLAHALPESFDYHRFDVFSIAYEFAATHGGIPALTLEAMCTYFHLPIPPVPHRALTDAQAAHAVFRELRRRQSKGDVIQ